MKIAIIMDYDSYAGREYADSLIKNGVDFDIISIGKGNEKSAEIEKERCGNLWSPREMQEIIKNTKHFNFPTLKSIELKNFLAEKKYDLGIQGGTGIVKREVFSQFDLGLLNFHPGDLPKYRGCSAPEWQLFERHPITSTCHLINEGIDTGDIYEKKVLKLNMNDYYSMRASIYPQTAMFVVEIITEIVQNNGFKHRPVKQNDDEAMYRNYIGDDKINFLINNFQQFKSYGL